jgi:acyl-CoA synthetase (AMP-forming)/AMP-acid ligase II
VRSLAARLRLGLGRDTTIGNVLERLAAVHGDRRLVEEPGGRGVLSYRQAAELVDRWAGGIAASISPGDRVVLATANGYDQLLLSLAVSRAGGIAVPVNAQMREDEIEHVIADAGADLVVRGPADVSGHAPLGRVVTSRPTDLAALFYTSGTTGRPKGVELSHRGLLGEGTRAALLPALQLRRDEAVIALPVAHIMGFGVLLGLAVSGIPVYELRRFRPLDVLDAIEDRRATIFVGVPAMYRLLLEAGAEERDLSSVRVWGSGADVMPADLAQRFRQMGALARVPFAGPVGEAVFFEGYGLAESGGAVAVKLSLPFVDRLLPGDSVGTPMPGYRMKVVDESGRPVRAGEVGELWIKGPNITPGYWGDAKATHDLLTDDGWLRTGDLASPGPLGSVRFAGRSKHVIKRGGYSVYAVEVEAALERHPSVAEAAVVGLPDARLGEVPAAAVRLQPGAAVEVDELLAFATEHLADYKVPVAAVVVDELPRTGTQKVQKDRLRALFAES